MACAATLVLQGKTCVVTGSSQGIGLEFVRQLLDKGNTVVAAARDPAASQGLQQLAGSHAGQLRLSQLDVSQTESIQTWAHSLVEEAKLEHIDLLINNAGVYGPRVSLSTVTAQDMQQVFSVNAVGPLLVVQQLRHAKLLGTRSGAPSMVANVTSKVGSVDDNRSGGGYAYRASKSALNIITKSMSIDLTPEGITCVLLHPGYVRTRMTDMNGLIDVHESVAGMLGVLQSSLPLNGSWYDFAAREIPW